MYPPDDSPCWAGTWMSVDPMVDLWAQSALARTVAALPGLHPWRLGDDRGSLHSLLWCAAPDAGGSAAAVAVLTHTAPPPSLPLGGDIPAGAELPTDAIWAAGRMRPRVAEAVPGQGPSPFRSPDPGVRRWCGAMAKLPGAWLPSLAILPRSRREIDDPGTRWETESLAFAERHTVHAADVRFASNVLAPDVTALILDRVPEDAAVTVAGDAIHLWWEYTPDSRLAVGRTQRTVEIAEQIRESLPSFVLADYPDESHLVEGRLAERAAEAVAYRASRTAGHNADPTLQRIYAQAQVEYERGHSGE